MYQENTDKPSNNINRWKRLIHHLWEKSIQEIFKNILTFIVYLLLLIKRYLRVIKVY